jgi:asparagine synthase (glutamine-hydrolysing)
VPFLDHELVELAARIPPQHKLAAGGKGILKAAARQIILNPAVTNPQGVGFGSAKVAACG